MNLCFHFAGSGENLPDITKSRDASMDNRELSLLLNPFGPDSDEAEQLPVLSHKLPFSVQRFHVISIKSCNNCGVTDLSETHKQSVTGILG